MTKYIFIAVCTFLFVETPSTYMVAEARELFVPSTTAVGYPGTCVYDAVYGSTVEEVGHKFIEEHNSVTTMECYQRCRNPASFYDADENNLVFRIKSLCTGSLYSVHVQINEKNNGPPSQCPN